MPFISPFPDDTDDAAVKALYDAGAASFGYLPNMFRAFSHRPEYMSAWGALLEAIKAHMEPERYEIVTLAAAREMKSSYCALAHGKILAEDMIGTDAVTEIMRDPRSGTLSPRDQAIFDYASQVIRDASSISDEDVQALRDHGLDDGEISDIAAAAAVRCFFSKFLDALGFAPDATYQDLPADLRDTLIVGRAIEGA